jgi:hypothetical protein
VKAHEPVHFSTLKYIEQSAAHYLHALQRDAFDSAPMRIGRGTHSLVLGGSPVVVYEGRRDPRMAAWRDFLSEHQDAEILSAAEMRAAEGMANAVAKHPDASRLIRESTDREYSISWEREGLKCKGRLDFMRRGEYLGDLKTCQSSEPERFWRDALRRAYHAQLSWYRGGLEFNGINCPRGYLIAVESAPPHPVTVIEVAPRAMDYGNRRCALWIERLRQCIAADYWPGYVEGIQLLDVPDADDFDLEDLDFSNNESGSDSG